MPYPKVDTREQLESLLAKCGGKVVTCLISLLLLVELQLRLALNLKAMDEYAELDKAGQALDPIEVTFCADSKRILVTDGNHRLASLRNNKRSHGLARVTRGTERSALQQAAGANAKHGVKRSTADKRNIVRALLQDREMRAWSSNELARIAGISAPTVEDEREKLAKERAKAGEPSDAPATRQYKRGGKTVEVKAPTRDTQPTDSEALVTRAVDRLYRLTKDFDAATRLRIMEGLRARFADGDSEKQ